MLKELLTANMSELEKIELHEILHVDLLIGRIIDVIQRQMHV